MALAAESIRAASAMGARAGEAFRDTGIPTPNPFDVRRYALLSDAWRRAYMGALAGRA